MWSDGRGQGSTFVICSGSEGLQIVEGVVPDRAAATRVRPVVDLQRRRTPEG